MDHNFNTKYILKLKYYNQILQYYYAIIFYVI